MSVPDLYDVLPGDPAWEWPLCGPYDLAGEFNLHPMYERTVDATVFSIRFYGVPPESDSWCIIRNFGPEDVVEYRWLDLTVTDHEKPNCGRYNAAYDPWRNYVNVQIGGERAGALNQDVPRRETVMVGY